MDDMEIVLQEVNKKIDMVLEANAILQKSIETQKEINKEYVDEVYELQNKIKELENENIELDAKYQKFVDFVTENYPAVAFEYITKKAKENGAEVIKL